MVRKVGVGTLLAVAVGTVVGVYLLTHSGGDLRAQVGNPGAGGRHAALQEIWDANCVRCHRGASPAAALDLTFERAYGQLVGVPSVQAPDLPRVDPGNPDHSYLFLKVAPGRLHLERGGRGRRMPLGASPLPPPVIRQIEDWIRAGAPP